MNVRRIRPALVSGLAMVALLLIATPTLAGGDQAVEIRVFEPDDLERIRAEHAGTAFVLMAWSLDCRPCHRKLSQLRPVLDANPDWRLVLVAVDPPERAVEIGQRIAEYGLERLDHWRFGDHSQERLRYALDPRWFGELPRSWLYNANHRVTALSGSLPDKRLARHFKGAD